MLDTKARQMWHDQYMELAVESFRRARGYFDNARLMEPEKNEADAYWRSFFVQEARRYNRCGVYYKRIAKEYVNG